MLRWLFYTLFSPTALQQINEAIIKLALLKCYFIHEWYRVWFILADWFQSLYSLGLILLTDTHTQHSNIREDERFKWWWVKRGGSVNAKHFIPASTLRFILSNIGSLEKLANTYIFAKLQERTYIYCSLKQKWTLEAGKQQNFKSFLNILPWP